jgi:hypothetical protein
MSCKIVAQSAFRTPRDIAHCTQSPVASSNRRAVAALILVTKSSS